MGLNLKRKGETKNKEQFKSNREAAEAAQAAAELAELAGQQHGREQQHGGAGRKRRCTYAQDRGGDPHPDAHVPERRGLRHANGAQAQEGQARHNGEAPPERRVRRDPRAAAGGVDFEK